MKNIYQEDLKEATRLLEECQYLLNMLPNTKNICRGYVDTYSLASDVYKYLNNRDVRKKL